MPSLIEGARRYKKAREEVGGVMALHGGGYRAGQVGDIESEMAEPNKAIKAMAGKAKEARERGYRRTAELYERGTLAAARTKHARKAGVREGASRKYGGRQKY